MADLGNSSTAGTAVPAGTATKHKATSWITVVLICTASIVLGFAFVLTSVPLAVLGGIIGMAGLVLGTMFKIMDDAH
jgi:uncharacterized membrane protein YoaK (UPF0700 family)